MVTQSDGDLIQIPPALHPSHSISITVPSRPSNGGHHAHFLRLPPLRPLIHGPSYSIPRRHPRQILFPTSPHACKAQSPNPLSKSPGSQRPALHVRGVRDQWPRKNPGCSELQIHHHCFVVLIESHSLHLFQDIWNKTWYPKAADHITSEKTWYIVDATDKILGRLASTIAIHIRGKNLATYTPSVDMGAFVIVVSELKVLIFDGLFVLLDLHAVKVFVEMLE